MFHHPQLTAGRQHAADLGEASRRIADAAEDEAAHHGVEGAVPERKLLGAGLDEPYTRGPQSGALQHVAGRIDADHRHGFRVVRQVTARATADVEHAAARAGGQPLTPSPEPPPVRQRRERIVEPGNLLDARVQAQAGKTTRTPVYVWKKLRRPTGASSPFPKKPASGKAPRCFRISVTSWSGTPYSPCPRPAQSK